MTDLNQPHGGELKNLYLDEAGAHSERERARDYASWDLSARQLCDIELLLNGGFSPLEGFMGKADYEAVCKDMRLADGTLWPMPITLDVTREFAARIKSGDTLALRDPEGVLIATMEVSDNWEPDLRAEAVAVFGSDDDRHPTVSFLLNRSNPVYVGGKLRGVEAPMHYDFRHLRDTPAEMRAKFTKLGWSRIVAFQTRNPMHRAHQELTFRAARQEEANLVIQPVVGMTKPGDIDHYTRVRCYEHLVKHYPEQSTMLSLLPLAMRMGGPREAVWHALIRKNYGFTHFIVGRDHAGPGKNSRGEDFYGPYDAQQLVLKYQDEIGITLVPFQMMVYVKERAEYAPVDETKEGETVLNISGTEFRRRLQEGLDIPEWFSFPDVVAELRKTHPPRHKQGFTVFFTGL
ncbi:MAG TPA: sulfate adenylyltransferase, partial [Gammaproteobacteria bacterium]